MARKKTARRKSAAKKSGKKSARKAPARRRIVDDYDDDSGFVEVEIGMSYEGD